MKNITVHNNDCLLVLADMPENSVDAVVTDPPYELGFMGKAWDASGIAFRPETWAEVIRVMKPGAHLVAFGAPKNYHRLACAIEDAGFDIRDSISYLYGTGPLLWTFGTGFPKSLNVSKALDDVRCRCCQENGAEAQPSDGKDLRDLRESMEASESLSSGEEFDVLTNMQCGEDFKKQDWEVYGGTDALRNMRDDDLSRSMPQSPVEECLLQPHMPGEGPAGRETAENSASWSEGADAGRSRKKAGSISHGEQSGVEGRRDLQTPEGKLQGRDLCESAGMGNADVAQGRIHHAASASDGGDVRVSVDAGRSGQSQGPQPLKQSSVKSRIVADERGSQTWRSWPVCERCGKPRIPEGLGTALKPAAEFIVLARKPLSEKTVAANVLRWGTGALNIDATRVGSEVLPEIKAGQAKIGTFERQDMVTPERVGRWPANLCHDGSQQVLDLFPHTKSGSIMPHHVRKTSKTKNTYGERAAPPEQTFGDQGSAARFFYSAKASKADRAGSKHPTVKPVALMQWLVRMVTPPGGTVLDPFAGSGTTGQACLNEDRPAILIEQDATYYEDILKRLGDTVVKESDND